MIAMARLPNNLTISLSKPYLDKLLALSAEDESIGLTAKRLLTELLDQVDSIPDNLKERLEKIEAIVNSTSNNNNYLERLEKIEAIVNSTSNNNNYLERLEKIEAIVNSTSNNNNYLDRLQQVEQALTRLEGVANTDTLELALSELATYSRAKIEHLEEKVEHLATPSEAATLPTDYLEKLDRLEQLVNQLPNQVTSQVLSQVEERLEALAAASATLPTEYLDRLQQVEATLRQSSNNASDKRLLDEFMNRVREIERFPFNAVTKNALEAGLFQSLQEIIKREKKNQDLRITNLESRLIEEIQTLSKKLEQLTTPGEAATPPLPTEENQPTDNEEAPKKRGGRPPKAR